MQTSDAKELSSLLIMEPYKLEHNVNMCRDGEENASEWDSNCVDCVDFVLG